MEAYFIPHCDLPNCELGSFEYTCPSCDRFQIDYQVWWQQDNIYGGLHYEFNCQYCNCDLVVSHNREEFEYQVIIK